MRWSLHPWHFCWILSNYKQKNIFSNLFSQVVTSRTRECFMSSVQLVRIRKFIKLTKKEFWIIIQIRTDQNQLRCQGRHPFASWIGSSTWIVTARQDQLRKIYPNLSFQVTEVPQLLEKIFRGGVDENIRPEVWILSSRRICFLILYGLDQVWKFLLGYYQWHQPAEVEHIEICNTDKKGCKILNFVHQVSRKQLIKMDGHKSSRTPQVRETNRRARVDEYFRMKLQWKSMSEEQQNKWVQKKVYGFSGL